MMNRLWVAFVLLVAAALAQNQMILNIYYPEGNLDNGNGTADLYIRGDGYGLTWDDGIFVPKKGRDFWQITLNYTNSVGTLECKLLVEDEAYQIGPNSIVPFPASGVSAVIITPWFFNGEGAYSYINNIYSPQLKNYRNLVVYTPPSYYENPYKNYTSVLFMHDGQNLFNASTAFGGIDWDCQTTVNEQIDEGNMREILIVGIDNTDDRIYELTYSYDVTEKAGGKGDLYLNFIVQTVMPIIENRYRVTFVPSETGILGSSLGGLISCYAGWTRSNVFGKAGCMSSSFWWNNEDFDKVILKVPISVNPQPMIYLDSGDSGPDHDDRDQTIRVRDHLSQLGFVNKETMLYYLDHGGEHNEYFWGQRFNIPMTFLYPPVPEPIRPAK